MLAAIYQWPDKDPGDLLDYSIDIQNVVPAGDTIVLATWMVPPGLTQVAETIDGTKAAVWLDGGTPNRTYQINVNVTTSEGRSINRDVLLRVIER